MPKLRAMAPVSRSIGVPSCVPDAIYAPRSIGAGSRREPPNASCTNSVNGTFRLATWAGKPAMAARRSALRSFCKRSIRRAFNESTSNPNSAPNAPAVPVSPAASGNVAPHTCPRFSRSRSSKNSVKPAIKSALVNSA